jgi:DNA-binding beta-propeller fold protein YncE
LCGSPLPIATSYALTFLRFTLDGKLLRTFGTPGRAGSGLAPLQFGDVADADGIDTMFVSDGDGGVNNRIVALDSKTGSVLFHVGGSSPGDSSAQFRSPHSIAYFPSTGLVFVADRGNNRTVAFAGDTGAYVGEWTCMRPGTPWGVRVMDDVTLLFQADGGSQSISIFNLIDVTNTTLGDCNIVEVVRVDISVCRTPHELALDPERGELYVACVGTPNSNIMRFVRECDHVHTTRCRPRRVTHPRV